MDGGQRVAPVAGSTATVIPADPLFSVCSAFPVAPPSRALSADPVFPMRPEFPVTPPFRAMPTCPASPVTPPFRAMSTCPAYPVLPTCSAFPVAPGFRTMSGCSVFPAGARRGFCRRCAASSLPVRRVSPALPNHHFVTADSWLAQAQSSRP